MSFELKGALQIFTPSKIDYKQLLPEERKWFFVEWYKCVETSYMYRDAIYGVSTMLKNKQTCQVYNF